MSTQGLYHYPARIVNESWTWEVAAFEPAEVFTDRTTAGKSSGMTSYLWKDLNLAKVLSIALMAANKWLFS